MRGASVPGAVGKEREAPTPRCISTSGTAPRCQQAGLPLRPRWHSLGRVVSPQSPHQMGSRRRAGVASSGTQTHTAIGLHGPLLRRQLPLLPASRENRQTSCHPAPFPSRLALKIKNSFHLSRPRERTREKEVCCQYMELSLSEGEKKKYGGEGGETREGTKPHFYFWWPAS